MSTEILSLADEILSTYEGLDKHEVRSHLLEFYTSSDEVVDAVISVLEGEGYFGDV